MIGEVKRKWRALQMLHDGAEKSKCPSCGKDTPVYYTERTSTTCLWCGYPIDPIQEKEKERSLRLEKVGEGKEVS